MDFVYKQITISPTAQVYASKLGISEYEIKRQCVDHSINTKISTS